MDSATLKNGALKLRWIMIYISTAIREINSRLFNQIEKMKVDPGLYLTYSW